MGRGPASFKSAVIGRGFGKNQKEALVRGKMVKLL